MSAVIANTPLSSVEQRKVRNYLNETNTTDQAAAITLLAECSWDLEKAVEKYVLNLSLPGSPEPATLEAYGDDDEEMEDESDEDYDDEEIEFDDEAFEMDVEPVRPASNTSGFFPRDFEEVEVAMQMFQESFNRKYPSANPPQFFLDGLKKALELCNELNRPLAIFVTNTKSVSQNIFCEKVFMNAGVQSSIRGNFVLFPWDLSDIENEYRLQQELRDNGLDEIAELINMLIVSQVESFPVLVPLAKNRGRYEMTSYVQSSDTSDSAIAKLYGASEDHRSNNRAKDSLRKEQEERQQLMRLQAQEYEASLAADRAKFEKKKQEEEEKKMEEEKKKKALEEEERKHMEELARREQMKMELPAEPAATEQGVLVVKFRLPEGKQMMRRFRPNETIQILANYLSSNGYPSGNHKYFNSDFPKKNILEKYSMESTFVDAKWPAREQIFVEEI